MNPKVEEFIRKAKEQRQIEEKKERDILLISLGLVDETKTIEIVEYSATKDEEHKFIDPQKKMFYKKDVFPAPIDVTDEEYNEILKYIPSKDISKNTNPLNKTKTRLKIVTTNEIQGYKVSQYLGLVNANIVIGANFIADWFASWTDVIGGYSGSYQDRLDEIYESALIELEEKANALNADAILGTIFDFNEISGKGKSMFMLTAYGSAVKLKREDK